jgi:hypothetical protein
MTGFPEHTIQQIGSLEQVFKRRKSPETTSNRSTGTAAQSGTAPLRQSISDNVLQNPHGSINPFIILIVYNQFHLAA